MKKIILLVVLVAIAGVAGLVRSNSRVVGNIREWPNVMHGNRESANDVRDEIRKSFELSPGARVEVAGINGLVKIETADTRTADVYIERTASSAEVLARRKIIVENTSAGLTIRGEKADSGFLANVFGSNPKERVTLRLPRQISLVARGINGSLTAAALAGPVEVRGVNGKVDIEQASGSATFSGINGNIAVALNQLDKDGVDISGINGNIELKLGDGLNADLEAHGMNGRVVSEMPNVVVEGARHSHKYSARIGNGGSSISVSGINGNVRLTRLASVS